MDFVARGGYSHHVFNRKSHIFLTVPIIGDGDWTSPFLFAFGLSVKSENDILMSLDICAFSTYIIAQIQMCSL